MAKASTTTETETNAAAKHETTSVTQLVPTLPKYILEIHRSDDKNAVDPVFVANGDYQVTLKRGVAVVASEATVTVLRDAITGLVDPQTKEVRHVPSYPFSAIPYDGPEKIGTVMDARTQKPVLKH